MRTPVLALALVVACAHSEVSYDYGAEPDPRRSEYVVGVADRLSIQVWRNQDLSREVVVRPDGTITLPLIGDVTADGKTPSQLKAEVTRQLSKYVREEGAVVTVSVVSVASYTFTVSGNVEKPGLYSSPRYVTVLEAIQLAGGPSRFANPRETKLMRRGAEGKTRTIPVDFTAIVDGSRPEANLVLVAGDQLFVP